LTGLAFLERNEFGEWDVLDFVSTKLLFNGLTRELFTGLKSGVIGSFYIN
jgi:hypothetical protein